MSKKKRVINKTKKRQIVGCVALAVLLGVSTYISVVVIGVVVDESKKGSFLNQGQTPETTTSVYVNQYNQYEDVTDSFQNTVPNVPVTDAVSNQVQDNDNQSNNQQPNDSSVVKPKPVNTLKDTNKTKADIVKIYADVMNNAKAKAPGFTKIEYQELPDGPENRVFYEGGDKAGNEAVGKMLDFVQGIGVFVPKEEAEAEPYIHQKGDADMARFPVFDRPKGSYLTDPSGIDSYTYQLLPNGNVKMRFVLVNEDNPEPIGENETIAPSYTGAVFSPMSKARIDGTVYHPIVTVFARDIKYSLKYHDCYVDIEFNPDTLEIAYLEQIAKVSIKGSGDVIGLGKIGLERQELIGTVIVKDFVY